MFTKLFAIARTTFQETIRQPIYGVLTWVAVALLLLNPTLAAFSLESGKDNKILQDVALSTMLLFGLLAAVFSASGVISREIESYTVLTVVSKPVSRPLFLVGKFLGVTAAVLAAYFFLTVVFLLTVRHGVMETSADKYHLPILTLGIGALLVSLLACGFGNFVYGWNFQTSLLGWVTPLSTLALLGSLFFDRQWKLQSPAVEFTSAEGAFWGFNVLYAVVLIFLAVLVLTAFAVAFSTRFNQVMTLLLCAGVLVMGLLSDYYVGQRAADSPLMRILYTATPNFQFFWIGDNLTQDILVPAAQVGRVVAYAFCYVLGVLGLGVAMFQNREVG